MQQILIFQLLSFLLMHLIQWILNTKIQDYTVKISDINLDHNYVSCYRLIDAPFCVSMQTKYMYIYIYICICMHVCEHVREIGRERERERERVWVCYSLQQFIDFLSSPGYLRCTSSLRMNQSISYTDCWVSEWVNECSTAENKIALLARTWVGVFVAVSCVNCLQ